MGSDNRFKLILLLTVGLSCSNLWRPISAEERQQNGFPGYVELVSRTRHSKSSPSFSSNNYNREINKNLNQNGDNHRRSRINQDFAQDRVVEIVENEEERNFVPVVTETNSKSNQDNKRVDDLGLIDKRKLLISNLDLFNGTDTKNLTDNQKLLLMQIADRVARYGENNLFRELASVQQQQQRQNPRLEEEDQNSNYGNREAEEIEGEEGRASKNTKKTGSLKRPTSGSTSASTKKRPSQPTQTRPANQTNTSAKTSKTKSKPVPPPSAGVNYTPLPPNFPTPPPSAQHLSTPSQNDKSTTIASSRHTKKPIEDVIYDYNVTASALIESLSQANPTASNNLLYQQTIHPAAAAGASSSSPAASTGQTATKAGNKKPIKTGTAKPTKYHYYPHNQHIYLLPECATQQVCNAVYVRLNFTQPLCACPQRYRDPCSASLNEDDMHTTKLIGDKNRRAITLAKTCESISEMKECREPAEWSLLAVQNTRTGKSHYLVICRCSDKHKLEGPMSHDQPSYANLPGIRVFGMKCVNGDYAPQRKKPSLSQRYPGQQPPPRPIHKYGDSGNYGQQQQQQQYQQNYQYLNRGPSSSSSPAGGSSEVRPSIGANFGGINSGYGRSNSESLDLGNVTVVTNEPNQRQEKSLGEEKRSSSSANSDYNNDDDGDYDNEPEFPWHRVQEFLQWNN